MILICGRNVKSVHQSWGLNNQINESRRHPKNGILPIENLELWTRSQPAGQRVKDKIEWCIDFLNGHGYGVIKL